MQSSAKPRMVRPGHATLKELHWLDRSAVHVYLRHQLQFEHVRKTNYIYTIHACFVLYFEIF